MYDPRIVFLRLRVAFLRSRIKRHHREKRKIQAERADAKDRLHGLLVDQIGLITMAWASLEMTLDAMISCAHRHGASTHTNRDHPVSLKSKLTYLRKMPRDVLAVRHLSTDLEALVDRIQSVKALRHDLTHGNCMIESEGIDVQIIRLMYVNGAVKPVAKVLRQDEISAGTTRIALLACDAATIGVSVAQVLGEREFENAFREIAAKAVLLRSAATLGRSSKTGSAER